LKGVAVPVPEGYEGEHQINLPGAALLNSPGLVVKSTEHKAAAPQKPTFPPAGDSDDEDEEAEEPPKMLKTVSQIKEMIVWDHDHQPATDDAFLKGVNEFIAFADAIHS
jgi:ribonuclease H2 subunit C